MSFAGSRPEGAIWVPPEQRRALRMMLAEMSTHRLEVTLAPSKREPDSGGMIRVVMDKNAEWYQRMCADYPSSRKRSKRAPDTAIKREHTLTALEKVLKTGWAVGFYQQTVLNYIPGFMKDLQAQRTAHQQAAKERRRQKRKEQREGFDPSTF